MAQRVFIAIAKNDKRTFLGLIHEKKSLLKERTGGSQSTVLHLASKAGNIAFVSEIIKLCPEMVAAENNKGETPLHEACRKGNAKVVMLLLETNPWIASLINHQNQSPFSIACSCGHLDVVKLLLSQSWLMDIEEDRIDQSCLHESISGNHTNVVNTILEARPAFAYKADKDGCLPLHYSCQHGKLEITRLLLDLAPELSQQSNNLGYTPLHLAAMKGETGIILEFMSRAPTSFKCLTGQAETVFHLAAKSGNFNVFISMAKIFKNTNLLHQLDQYGNTILHLAISAGCYKIAEYIINDTKVDVNHRNQEGCTALDLLNQVEVTSEMKYITDLLLHSGGKKSIEMTIPSPEVPTVHAQTMTPESLRYTGNGPTVVTKMQQHNSKSQIQIQELKEFHKSNRRRLYQIHREASLNARNTIILVAILIASVTFTVGLNPPGGVNQDGDKKGEAAIARKLGFKIFLISNSIALFTSLCIVLILVSIIPFQRKKLMKLMVITHKVMWVSVFSMATSFVAATLEIIPKAHTTRWMLDAISAIGSGSMVIVFTFLGFQLARHWLRKLKWKKSKDESTKPVDIESQIPPKSKIQPVEFCDEDGVQSESSNSDVDSAKSFGYHTY